MPPDRQRDVQRPDRTPMNPVQYAADIDLGFTSVWLHSEMVLLVLFGWFVWDSLSSHSRHGWALILSEFVATFGLLSVIWWCSRRQASKSIRIHLVFR